MNKIILIKTSVESDAQELRTTGEFCVLFVFKFIFQQDFLNENTSFGIGNMLSHPYSASTLVYHDFEKGNTELVRRVWNTLDFTAFNSYASQLLIPFYLQIRM